MSTKRKHKTLPLKDKMDILKRLDNGDTIGKLAREYGVGSTTIHDLKKNKDRIVSYVRTMKAMPEERKTLRFGIRPKMEKAVYTWFVEERSKGTLITGDILRAKAVEFYKETCEKSDFSASSGWLHKFKKRFGIRLSGEKPSEPKVEPFARDFAQKVAQLGLLPDQVYSARESALTWKYTSDESVRKDRIIFMPCSNATGTHKLDLLVVGRTKNPKALHDVRAPVSYKNDSRSWVSSDVLAEWFRDDFVPEVRRFMRWHDLPPKALLILDSAPNELHLSDGEIRTIYAPPNLQPMDENVLREVKAPYNSVIERGLADLTLKELVFALANGWSSVPPNLIRSSWTKLWPDMDAPVTENGDWLRNKEFQIKEEDLTPWFDGREEMGAFEEVKVEENRGDVSSVTAEAAFDCFGTCIKWAEENGVAPEDVAVLRNMRDKVYKPS